ncbi:MAG: tRNA preQ1(34) S-adenosylmethionine ribosyltransferase-isomerase QueA [Helicobacteraceae bacterium]|nr:tRNA preQ1(34) S-adenosylmethionine ribosyltransferase-isomerase QueA [Helicobacteraceae bacterium]
MSLQTSSYDYTLPSDLIATHPSSPRESAKLLVYNSTTKKITHTIFSNIQEFIPKDSAIIFNDTKVIKARLFGKKESGGKLELLINRPLNATTINIFIRGRVKPNTIIYFDENLTCKVLILNEDGSRDVEFYQDNKLLRFEDLIPILNSIGHIPLPPYINREDNKEDETEYQSVWAKNEGAVAAPTASLHFSDQLFSEVQENYKTAFVTLHVGAGTFKPVEAEIITDHPMHSEYYDISDQALKILQSDQKLLAVGTTSTRTIEYYARVKSSSGEANLFLHPQNTPKRVDYLLTNFHLPKSTLLMLVASFIGVEETHRIYEEAIKKEYKFFSYGDAMLII